MADDADKLKSDIKIVLEDDQMRAQLKKAIAVLDEMKADRERQGYVWSLERGCFVHPDGDEWWIGE